MDLFKQLPAEEWKKVFNRTLKGLDIFLLNFRIQNLEHICCLSQTWSLKQR
jgi:hypothetical protein